MNVKLTEHFWYRWKKRKDFMLKEGITPEKIIEFVKNPDMTLPDPKHSNREWKIKRIGNRCLRIVVEIKEDKLEIVTAFFDRTLRRKGLCG